MSVLATFNEIVISKNGKIDPPEPPKPCEEKANFLNLLKRCYSMSETNEKLINIWLDPEQEDQKSEAYGLLMGSRDVLAGLAKEVHTQTSLAPQQKAFFQAAIQTLFEKIEKTTVQRTEKNKSTLSKFLFGEIPENIITNSSKKFNSESFTFEEEKIEETSPQIIVQEIINEMQKVPQHHIDIYKKVEEIAKLQQVFSEKVYEQSKQIDNIESLALFAHDNILDGNKNLSQAKDRMSSYQRWILTMLATMILILVFMHNFF